MISEMKANCFEKFCAFLLVPRMEVSDQTNSALILEIVLDCGNTQHSGWCVNVFATEE